MQDNQSIYFINFELDDRIKEELIYRQIKYAQDVLHPHYLSNLKVYDVYHVPLETYFMKYFTPFLI